MTGIPCSVDGCQNRSAKGGLCWGHYRRRQRGQPLNAALAAKSRTPWAAVLKSALVYAEAEEDRDWERASVGLLRAVHRYMQSLPSYRELLQWVGRQERFRRGAIRQLRAQERALMAALKQLRPAAPIPSLHSLKWVGPETLKSLREARK